MAISVDEAMSAYGFVYTLAKSVPELNDTLSQAIQGGWTADKLTATIESGNWWQSHSDTVRNLVQLQATDPATYTQNLNHAKQLVILKGQALGRVVDDKQATSIALETLASNSSWDDQVLTQTVANRTKIDVTDTGAYLGQAANLRNHLTQVFQNYGVAYTKQWLDFGISQIESGRDTLDGFESYAKQRAKAAYPQFANQLDAGMTIRDIADPYISTYAQTLEVPETSVTLKDSMIKKALQQTGEDGTTRTSMPLWQFERTLKNDPRYDHTKQAKGDAMDLLAQIGKDWGFVGGGQ